MSQRKGRRIPIVDERGSLVGIVSQADLLRPRARRQPRAKTVEKHLRAGLDGHAR
jgi:CBS-domain-containing membrane protein